MAKVLKTLIRKTILAEYDNLVSLDDPYVAIRGLLKDKLVSGILDAGASNGRVSKKLLQILPNAKVFAFEPNPEYKETLERIQAEDERIIPLFFALSNEPGRVVLNVTKSLGATSIFSPSDIMKKIYPDESVIAKSVDVECITIDSWWEKNNKPDIEMMKFDIQGCELLALRGAVETLKKTLMVYTEVFFNRMYDGGAIYSEIDIFLREQGFSLFNFYKVRSDQNKMLEQANAIFVKTCEFGF